MGFVKRLWAWLASPSARTPLGVLLALGFVVGIFFIGTFHFVMSATNSMDLCLGCHEMQWIFDEYKETTHYTNKSGVRATCADCHVPRDKNFGGWIDKIVAKFVIGTKDIYAHAMGKYPDKKTWNAGREHMAESVTAYMQSRKSAECRTCHSFEAMNFGEQDRQASNKHRRGLEEGKTCIDCHAGVAHKLPEDLEDEEEEDKDAAKEEKSAEEKPAAEEKKPAATEQGH